MCHCSISCVQYSLTVTVLKCVLKTFFNVLCCYGTLRCLCVFAFLNFSTRSTASKSSKTKIPIR